MSIYAAPGQPFKAAVQGFPTGLTGTVGVRILDDVGGTTTARTTAGIVETPAGSGFYAATLTAPSAAGTYSVFWDQGVVSPTTTAGEELIVTSSLAAVAVPQPGDLCTLADVRAYQNKPTADTAQDALTQSLITRASRLIMRECQREFSTTGTNPQTRTFRYPDTGGFLSFAPYDLQSASAVVFNPESSSPLTLDASVGDYELQPVEAPDGVYTGMRFSGWRWLGDPTNLLRYGYRQLRITGNWGFPAPPFDVVQACVVTVALWLRRDVQIFSATFSIDEGRLERPQALPSAVQAMLDPWRRSWAA